MPTRVCTRVKLETDEPENDGAPADDSWGICDDVYFFSIFGI